MRKKFRRAKSRVDSKSRLKTVLDDAFDQSIREYLDAVPPRVYVELRTMSSFELGLRFKRALRDALYDRHHGGRRRMAEPC
ncbi:conserved hypothetical protein [Paraburkholderia ribeironis]|uniref:Uncharacterized protein n=1 Tax=Paraburkholderia ribeironis TaxID=1247936 RepID=A0A1N7S943_9BURK|nr:conserved hypothetical protein [Paraburkholderia ribeironis]